jgi:hypothetical protein
VWEGRVRSVLSIQTRRTRRRGRQGLAHLRLAGAALINLYPVLGDPLTSGGPRHHRLRKCDSHDEE